MGVVMSGDPFLPREAMLSAVFAVGGDNAGGVG